MEQWKPVTGFEGLYEVSNLGRVRSLDRYVNSKNGSQALKRGKVLSLGYTAHPNPAHRYVHTTLYKDGELHGVLVHRLVAQAFIPNPEGKPQVNHKKSPKTNNAVTNLEWATKAEDDAYAKLHGQDAKGELHGMAKLTAGAVMQMRQLFAQGRGRHELASMFDISKSHTDSILRGATWKHVPLKPQPQHQPAPIGATEKRYA